MNQEKLDILYAMIKECPFIGGNPNYRDVANSTYVKYSDSDVVNAYAGYDNQGKKKISIHAGIVNLFDVFAYAMASGETEMLRSMMGAARRIMNGKNPDVTASPKKPRWSEFSFFDRTRCIELYSRKPSDHVRREAESILAGAVLGVLGHELGHHCLGHVTLKHPYGSTNIISRNDERCADLFSSSVVDTTMFARYSVLGSVIVSICLTWTSDEEFDATTHPDSKERVEYIYNSHEKELVEYGITRDIIEEMLP